MKKFFVGLLVGFLYLTLLVGTYYRGVVDECESRGYNSAFIGAMGSVCIHTYGLERDDFRMSIGNF